MEALPRFNPQALAEQQRKQDEVQAEQLQQMKAADETRSKQLSASIIKELEAEIAKYRQLRQQQLQQRRQQQVDQEAAATEAGMSPLQEPTSKRKSGLLGGGGRRIKSAQQKSQPETVGKRTSG